MGVLGLTDIAKVQAFSNLPEVASIDPVKLQTYIDRAEFIASRLFDYDNTLPAYALQMEYAIDMLVENMVIQGIPSFKRSGIAKMRSEQIGSYSYTMKDETKGGANWLLQYMTEEVWFILNAYKAGTSPHNALHTTHVFIPRTAKIDDTGVHYFIPEDETVNPINQDPPNPERVS
jgi:hypothetical protein